MAKLGRNVRKKICNLQSVLINNCMQRTKKDKLILIIYTLNNQLKFHNRDRPTRSPNKQPDNFKTAKNSTLSRLESSG